jgi:hypothetical protein
VEIVVDVYIFLTLVPITKDVTSRSTWELIHSYFNEITLIWTGLSTVKTSRPDKGTVAERVSDGDERSIEGSSTRISNLTILDRY